MKKYYMVSFKWSDTVYCANVAHGLCLNGIPAMAVIVPESLAETL